MCVMAWQLLPGPPPTIVPASNTHSYGPFSYFMSVYVLPYTCHSGKRHYSPCMCYPPPPPPSVLGPSPAAPVFHLYTVLDYKWPCSLYVVVSVDRFDLGHVFVARFGIALDIPFLQPYLILLCSFSVAVTHMAPHTVCAGYGLRIHAVTHRAHHRTRLSTRIVYRSLHTPLRSLRWWVLILITRTLPHGCRTLGLFPTYRCTARTFHTFYGSRAPRLPHILRAFGLRSFGCLFLHYSFYTRHTRLRLRQVRDGARRRAVL